MSFVGVLFSWQSYREEVCVGYCPTIRASLWPPSCWTVLVVRWVRDAGRQERNRGRE